MILPFGTALLALTAAACWGAGDFVGGLVSRRFDVLRSVLISYSVGLAALVIVALARREPLPALPDLGWGALSGLCGMVGIGFLYKGFASGRMGIVAPVSGVLAAAIPVIFNGFIEGLPRFTQLTGFGVAALGIWLLARPERLSGATSGLGLAFLAGCGFGSFFITLDQVTGSAVFWPLVAGRVSACSVLLVFLLVKHRLQLPPRPLLGLLTLSGALDVSGNFFFLLAVQSGRLDIAAVLGSLYPAVTAILALLAIKERLTRLQVFGVTAALLAIVLITSG